MQMQKVLVAGVVALATGGLLSPAVLADERKSSDSGVFGFKPISESADAADWDPTAPWVVPKGYTQQVVSNESNLNIYDGGRDDWHDMNVVNETGPQAGRFMYRTHEVRGVPEGGAVSVVDLETGETRILAQDVSYDALDGIRWTPWGTILFAEEIEGGRLLEIYLESDLMTAAAVVDRPAVGRMAHEGIDLDADGAIYVVDEHRGETSGCALGTPCGGGVYKFVPDVPGDLSSGNLYVLSVNGPDGIGQGTWAGPIDPSDARTNGTLAGGTSYQRPEDVEVIDNVLYVAITEGPRAQGTPGSGREVYEGRVIAVDLATLYVSNFVVPGANVPIEKDRPGVDGWHTGFDSVDNLAETPDGKLMMIEDNVPSDIWIASSRTNKFGLADEVWLFASLSDPEAEGTGIYFSPKDPRTLYVNVQHSAADDGDATWAITRKKSHRSHSDRDDH